MALEPDPLDRAIGAARAETPEGWVELSQSVLERVRDLTLPGDPVVVRDAAGRLVHDEEGSRTFVSTRVLVRALRVLLRSEPTHVADGIRLDVEDGVLTGVDLSLVAAYGVDLRALADDVRGHVVAELVALLGPGALTPAEVDVSFTDVVDGDPRLT
jgi:uncharacterized alkaline shock family protein YloU